MKINRINSNEDEDKLSDLLERVDKISRDDELKKLVQESKDKYGVKNISFAGFNLGNLTLIEPVSVWTYNPSWIDHYRRSEYLKVDPVVKTVPNSILPVDWSQFDLRDKLVKSFFGEAKEAGVGSRGLSIPVRGRNGEFSIFSLTFDESERDWKEYKRKFMRDFQVLAVFFHQSMLRAHNISMPVYEMSTKELQVLYWAACGKTAEETSIILGMTRRTVRYHCSNILTKLNAVNIAHAVGKAVYFNLINPPK